MAWKFNSKKAKIQAERSAIEYVKDTLEEQFAALETLLKAQEQIHRLYEKTKDSFVLLQLKDIDKNVVQVVKALSMAGVSVASLYQRFGAQLYKSKLMKAQKTIATGEALTGSHALEMGLYSDKRYADARAGGDMDPIEQIIQLHADYAEDHRQPTIKIPAGAPTSTIRQIATHSRQNEDYFFEMGRRMAEFSAVRAKGPAEELLRKREAEQRQQQDVYDYAEVFGDVPAEELAPNLARAVANTEAAGQSVEALEQQIADIKAKKSTAVVQREEEAKAIAEQKKEHMKAMIEAVKEGSRLAKGGDIIQNNIIKILKQNPEILRRVADQAAETDPEIANDAILMLEHLQRVGPEQLYPEDEEQKSEPVRNPNVAEPEGFVIRGQAEQPAEQEEAKQPAQPANQPAKKKSTKITLPKFDFEGISPGTIIKSANVIAGKTELQKVATAYNQNNPRRYQLPIFKAENGPIVAQVADLLQKINENIGSGSDALKAETNDLLKFYILCKSLQKKQKAASSADITSQYKELAQKISQMGQSSLE